MVKEGAIIGGGLGLAISTPIAIKKALKVGTVIIKQSKQFEYWKACKTKEQYELFLYCIKNFAKDADFEDFICPIAQDIPLVPVASPNGHVYDKEAIETHLDIQWAKIEGYRASGYTKAQLQKKMTIICPMRSQSFKKEDLKYDIDFAKNAIKFLKGIKAKLQIDPDEDPILEEGCNALLEDYQQNYAAVKIDAIMQLTRELTILGATEKQTRDIIAEYQSAVRV